VEAPGFQPGEKADQTPNIVQANDCAPGRDQIECVSVFASQSTTSSAPQHASRGVAGWLLFFCLGLTFIAPITQAHTAISALGNLVKSPGLQLATMVRLTFVFVIYSGLSIYSLVAGLVLWRENPKGVWLAKAYLILSSLLPIGLFTVLALAGRKVDLLDIVLRRLIYSLIWYAYLVRSERVKATYFEGRS